MENSVKPYVKTDHQRSYRGLSRLFPGVFQGFQHVLSYLNYGVGVK